MQLKRRVQELENKLARIEKEHKKENIVIKGLDPTENINKIDVQEFIEEKMGIKVEIKEVERIGINNSRMIIKAKMNNMDNKRLVMKNKNKLKGTKYFIDPKFTNEEEKIQKKLREEARVERDKGKQVKVEYQKIRINSEWYKWDVQNQELTKSETNGKPKN
ncbi:hypothetical protein QE152_g27532 [Popillia japonica]|uniref:Uncharacterized protein n=1 Tax=Popillia japonica TaxID=7064 RepID=A0AAW1JUJ7_POPJA